MMRNPAVNKHADAAFSSKDWLDYIPRSLHAWLVPIALLVVWQIVGGLGLVSPKFLPTPFAIAVQFWTLIVNGELWGNLKVSLFRVGIGFILGGLAGLMLGLSSGLSKLTERTLDPSLQMLRTVPLLSLIPLFILWFGVGEFAKVLMIALGAFFPLYVNTFLGVRSVDVKLYEVSRILQYSIWKIITKLIVPAALPNVLLGIRLAIGASWLVLVVSEMMGTSAGIGYMIQDARAYSETDIVFVGLILFAIMGKLSDSIVRFLESRWLRWRDTFKG